MTTDFYFLIFDAQANSANAYFEKLIKAGTLRKDLQKGRGTLKVYKLTIPYTAMGNNCTTLSLEAAKQAVPKIDEGSKAFIKPDTVMNWSERAAMKTLGGGTPDRIFLPANLQEFLQTQPSVKPNRIETYGGKRNAR